MAQKKAIKNTAAPKKPAAPKKVETKPAKNTKNQKALGTLGLRNRKANPDETEMPGASQLHKSPKKEAPKRPVREYKKGTKKVNVYSITGKVESTTTLPQVFDETFRPHLIRRDVVAIQANRRQPYGPGKRAGMRHAVSTWGKGRGVARVQRFSQGRTAAESPNNVGGRRAHPPYPEHNLGKKINRKERLKARNSALAAVADPEIVITRGHKFNRKLTLPIIVTDHFEKIQKTKKVVDSLDGIGVYSDVVRSQDGRHIRAGRGKLRGRRYRTPTSVLIIVNDKQAIGKAARNLSGVDVITPGELNTEMLAPGGDPGRLTVISQSALKELGGL